MRKGRKADSTKELFTPSNLYPGKQRCSWQRGNRLNEYVNRVASLNIGNYFFCCNPKEIKPGTVYATLLHLELCMVLECWGFT